MTCQLSKCPAHKLGRCSFKGCVDGNCTVNERQLFAEIYVATAAMERNADRVRLATRLLEARHEAREGKK